MVTYAGWKRLIDVAVSGIGCLLLLPVFFWLALAIRMETPGSPFFGQQRIGSGGKVFRLWKFRSMVKDAPSLGSWQTSADDPRITRIGRFIRATSLDELPQLWNVLKGEMSLIGPRPEVPVRESSYTPADWQLRHSVRPGITGLAQVHGRSQVSDEDQLRYDLKYAAGVSFRRDVGIVIKTVLVALQRAGVN